MQRANASGEAATPGADVPATARVLWLTDERLPLVLGAALFGWLVFLAIVLPIDPDEAVYNVIARGMLDGKWPYRDLFDHKPPLIYVWHLPGALGLGITGERIIAAAACAASVPVLAVVARQRLANARQIALALGSYVTLMASPYLGVNSNTEAFSLLPIIAAVAVPSPLLAGILLGTAAMTKLPALVFLAVLAMRWRRRFSPVALGCGAVIAAVSLPFIPIWSDYWEANVAFSVRYSGQFSWAERLSVLFIVHPLLLLTALPVWIAAAIGAIRHRDRFLIVWLVCGYIVAKGSGFDFTHYYMLMLPPVALLAGQGMDAYLQRRPFRWVSPFSAAWAISFVLIGLIAAFSITARNPYEEFIKDHPVPEGELYVLGHFSEIYTYADREPQRRFFFSVPLVLNDDWDRETREGLFACPPEVLVIPDEAENLFPIPWREELAARYATRQEYESGVVLTGPRVPCAR